MVRPARFERATYGFEVRRSIQLSYGRMFVQMTRLRLTATPRQAENQVNILELSFCQKIPTELNYNQKKTNSGSFDCPNLIYYGVSDGT